MTEPSIEQLEQALFSALESRRQKVAMIVQMATKNFPGFWDGAEDAIYGRVDEGLARLAARDDVLCFGNIAEWRHSEMCRHQAAK